MCKAIRQGRECAREVDESLMGYSNRMFSKKYIILTRKMKKRTYNARKNVQKSERIPHFISEIFTMPADGKQMHCAGLHGKDPKAKLY